MKPQTNVDLTCTVANASWLVRWHLTLEEFGIEYKSGKTTTNTVALSRVEIHTKEVEELTKLAQYVQ